MDGWMDRYTDEQTDGRLYLVQNRNGLETVGINKQNVFSVTWECIEETWQTIFINNYYI